MRWARDRAKLKPEEAAKAAHVAVDATSGDQQRGGGFACQQVSHFRHQRECRPGRAMPPASLPWATTMSAPHSSAARVCAIVCTWQISRLPAALIAGANGAGSPNDSINNAGACASTLNKRRGQRPW